MKVFGSVALGSSSARKYLRTCVSCFQKLRVSCEERCVSDHYSLSLCPYVPGNRQRGCTYLEFSVAVVDEDVDGLELCDVAVALELLPHLGANGRDWHVQGVHGLDLGCLESCASRQPSSHVFRSLRIFLSSSSCSLLVVIGYSYRTQPVPV